MGTVATPQWVRPAQGAGISSSTPWISANLAAGLAEFYELLYRNSDATDAIAQVYVTSTRLRDGVTPVVDTGFVGTPSLPLLNVIGGPGGAPSNSPAAIVTDLQGRSWVTIPTVNSGTTPGQVGQAPIMGGSIGTWRFSLAPLDQKQRNIVSQYATVVATVAGQQYIYRIGGLVNASGVNTPLADVVFAPVNADGTIGAWTYTTPLPSALTFPAACAAPLPDAATSNPWLVVLGGSSTFGGTPPNAGYTANTGVYTAQLNSDGSVSSWTTTSTGLTTAVYAAGCWYSPEANTVYIAGGATGAAPQSVVYGGRWNYSGTVNQGTIASWSNQNNLGTAACNGAAVLLSPYENPTLFNEGQITAQPDELILVSGLSAANTGLTTVQKTTTPTLVPQSSTLGVPTLPAWSTYTALPAATGQGCAVVVAYNSEAWLTAFGGITAAGAANVNAYSARILNNLNMSGSWFTGVSPGLTQNDVLGISAALGNNATLNRYGFLTTNPDGSQLMGFVMGAQLPAGAGTVQDGDQYQYFAFMTAVSGNGAVNLTPVTVQCNTYALTGTVSNPTADGGSSFLISGQPVLGFSFKPKVGSSGEANWRITLTDNVTSAIVFDSGLQSGAQVGLNSIKATNISPPLVQGRAYQLSASVTILDNPLPDVPGYVGIFSGGGGYINSDAAYLTSTSQNASVTLTAALGIPAAPTSVTVTADNTNGAILVSAQTAAQPLPAPTSSQVPAPTASGSGGTLSTSPHFVGVEFLDVNGRRTCTFQPASVTPTAGQKVVVAVTLPALATSFGVYLGNNTGGAFPALRRYATISAAGAITYDYTNSSGISTSVAGSTVTVTFAAEENGSSLVTALLVPQVANAATVRLYYRPAGSGSYTLLRNIASNQRLDLGNSGPDYGAFSFGPYIIMDEVALNTAYDFQVTAVSAAGTESAAATVTNVQITPITGDPANAYTASLHIAGGTPAISFPASSRVTMLYNPTPKFAHHIAVAPVEMFGDGAPKTRYGSQSYDLIDIPVWGRAISNSAAIEAVLNTALAQGAQLYYRDVYGLVLRCTLDAERQRQYEPPSYQNKTVRLRQVQYTYAP